MHKKRLITHLLMLLLPFDPSIIDKMKQVYLKLELVY